PRAGAPGRPAAPADPDGREAPRCRESVFYEAKCLGNHRIDPARGPLSPPFRCIESPGENPMRAGDTPEPSWSDHVDQFLAHLRDEEKSAHTQRNYRDDLLAFAAWYRDHNGGDDPELARIAKRDVLHWKDHVEKQGGRLDRQGNARAAALATVNRKLSAVRSFVRWAQDLGLSQPFEPPKPRRRQGRSKPRSLEPDERKALIRTV